jgi:hypothetical protein
MTEDSPPNRIGRAELLRVGPVFRPAARGLASAVSARMHSTALTRFGRMLSSFQRVASDTSRKPGRRVGARQSRVVRAKPSPENAAPAAALMLDPFLWRMMIASDGGGCGGLDCSQPRAYVRCCRGRYRDSARDEIAAPWCRPPETRQAQEKSVFSIPMHAQDG